MYFWEKAAEIARICFQSSQKCICDTEHMFNCPENSMNMNSNEAAASEDDNEVDNGQASVIKKIPFYLNFPFSHNILVI